MIPVQVINSVVRVCVCMCVWVSGSVFMSGECRMAGLIISTIKGKYIQLHPGQVLMKDSRHAGLFHLSSVVVQYLHLWAAAWFCFISDSTLRRKSHISVMLFLRCLFHGIAVEEGELIQNFLNPFFDLHMFNFCVEKEAIQKSFFFSCTNKKQVGKVYCTPVAHIPNIIVGKTILFYLIQTV